MTTQSFMFDGSKMACCRGGNRGEDHARRSRHSEPGTIAVTAPGTDSYCTQMVIGQTPYCFLGLRAYRPKRGQKKSRVAALPTTFS